MLRRHVSISLFALALCVAASPALKAHARGQGQVHVQAPPRTTAQAPKKSATAGVAPTATTPLNINTATATELVTLPGIGPAVATRIIEYRQKNGAFKKIEELMNVKGIGEKSFLKIKALITAASSKTTDR